MRLARYSWLLALFLVIGSLLPSSSPAKGAVIGPPYALNANGHWSTTSGFDSGTFGVPADNDGEYTMEDSTLNAGIAANSLELASLKGSTFPIAKADGNTFKWSPKTAGDAGGSASATQTGGYYETSALRTSVYKESGAAGVATLTGTLDVRLRINVIVSGFGPYFMLQNENVLATGSTVDGVRYRWQSGATLKAYTVTDNVETQCGSDTSQSTNPIDLRITRSGTTVTWYYSTNGGSTWTQDEQCTFTTSSALYPEFMTDNRGGSASTDRFDNFSVASGTVGSGGFRTAGDWISDHYLVPAGQVRVGFVNLTFSGVTSTYAIDKVELYRDDVLRQVFANDITTGTNANLTVTEVIEGGRNVSVRVYLKGDGAGTPTITSIQVFLVTLQNTVVTVVAYQIGQHSVILAGNVTFDAEPDGKLLLTFNYGKEPQVGTSVTVGWVGAAGNFTVLLYELEPGSVYYFQAQATGNVSGTADGVVASFTTQGAGGMSTLLIVLLIVFVLLLLLGFKFPIMHIFGGIEGVFLGLQIFNELGDTALAGIVAGVAVLFVLIGAARIYDGVRT